MSGVSQVACLLSHIEQESTCHSWLCSRIGANPDMCHIEWRVELSVVWNQQKNEYQLSHAFKIVRSCPVLSVCTSSTHVVKQHIPLQDVYAHRCIFTFVDIH
eukprot:5490860-Amphidinium_carterae.1